MLVIGILGICLGNLLAFVGWPFGSSLGLGRPAGWWIDKQTDPV